MFIDDGFAHVYFIEYIFELVLDLLDSSGRTDIATFHAQDAGFFTWDDVWRIDGGETVLQFEVIDTTIGAGFTTLAAVDAAI